MNLIEVRDFVLWPKHIHGTGNLKEALLALEAGEIVELVVNGYRGHWEKMADGKDGRPTPGLKPIGMAKKEWHGLKDRWGDLVEIKRAAH